MKLSRGGQRAIVFSSIFFFTYSLAFLIPSLMLCQNVHSPLPLVVMFCTQIGAAGFFDLTFYRVIKKEVPNYPFKRRHYSAAQAAWVKSQQQKLLSKLKSKWPISVLALVLAAALMGPKSPLEGLATWILSLSLWPRVLMVGGLSVVGAILGVMIGKLVGEKRIRNAEELTMIQDDAI